MTRGLRNGTMLHWKSRVGSRIRQSVHTIPETRDLRRFLDVVASASISRVLTVTGVGLAVYAALVPTMLEVSASHAFFWLPVMGSIACLCLWTAHRMGMLQRLQVHRLAFTVLVIVAINIALPLFYLGETGYIIAVSLLVVVVAMVFLRQKWYWIALGFTMLLSVAAISAHWHTLTGAAELWLLVSVAVSVSLHRVLSRNFLWLGTQRHLLKAAARDAERGRERLRISEGFANAVSTISARLINLEIDRIDEQIDQALGVIARYCDVDRCSVYMVDDRAGVMKNAHEWCTPGVQTLKQLFDGVVPLDTFPWIRKRLQLLETVELSSIEDLPEEAVAERELVRQLGIKSLLLVPISNEGHIKGFFELSNTRDEVHWNQSFRNILQIAAQSFSNAIVRKDMEQRLHDHIAQRREAERRAEKLRRMESDMGSRIQRTLLFGDIPRDTWPLTVHASTTPSRSVDGDFFEFIAAEPGLDVLIGDVMGKGTPAALVAAAAKSRFWQAIVGLKSGASASKRPAPAQIVGSVSQAMSSELLELNTFFTLSYARFDTEQAICRVVDCGHPPLLRFRRNTGIAEWLRGVNLPVGMHESEIYRELVLPLEAGDVFVAYSDGVTEAASAQGEQFGYARLARTVHEAVRAGCAEEIVGAIEHAVREFSGDAGPADDVTCAVTCIDETYSVPETVAELHMTVRSTDRMEDVVSARVGPVLRDVYASAGCAATVDSVQDGLVAALLNVVHHAHRGIEAGSIDISLRASRNYVMLKITHGGQPYDPAAQVRGGRVVHETGSGLRTMDQSFDSVTYTYSDDGKQHMYLTSYFPEAT